MPRLIPRLAPFLVILAAASCRAPFLPDNGGATPPPPPPPGPLLPLRIGSSGPDFARAVANDAAGNAYVVSYFANTVDFDGGVGATAKVAHGPYDIALAKYASDGTFQWVNAIGGSDVDVPYGVKVGPDGAAYVVGYVTAGADCNGHIVQNHGDHDVLIMRITAEGVCDWAIGVGGSGPDEAHDLAFDSNGDLLVTGFFSDTVDFDPGPDAHTLESRGGTDIFVARYGEDGSFKSVAQFGGLGNDVGNALAVRLDGDIIFGGSFNNAAVFGSSLAPLTLISSGGLDYFVARLSTSLDLEWAIHGGGGGDDMINPGCIVASPTGLIYVAGTFNGVASVGPGVGGQALTSHGGADIFLTGYDGGGNWIGFARVIGGTGTDAVAALAQDAVGNFYLSGSFQGSVDFDPGSGTHVVPGLGTGGASDAFVVSLTPGGDLRWVDPLTSVISGETFLSIANGISLAGDGSIWAVGRFFGLVDFDPGAGSVSRQSVGDADQFIVRYDQTTGSIIR
ncbi:MAG TPA: hypothetical protein VGM20_04465 [Gemmatimonadales bacterium]|jgi:hypothetical protein